MKLIVRGIVQGVGFRPAVYRTAVKLGLNGYVQNNGSNVVIAIDGDWKKFIDVLKSELPALAKIDSIELEEDSSVYHGFRIIESSDGGRGASIPNDTALCEDCIAELFDTSCRRYLYPFTNCTNCGARFSIISDIPYDRISTSMCDYPACSACSNEYEDPFDRRFHHQTISCADCGPSYYLITSDGKRIYSDPIKKFARLIDNGAIGVAKSWGGMHICANLDVLPYLRSWYKRKEKPFAVMAKDLNHLKKYCEPTEYEIKELISPNRPIVLVKKIQNDITELISPGLDNIGMFLPYSAMQHILFHHLEHDAIVVTSANPPGEPMVLKDGDALELGADAYLLHNRNIINRCDDSVMRVFENHPQYIRKSRGHIPSYIECKNGEALAVGGQENLCGAVSKNGRLYTTQYIGDGEKPGVIRFLDNSIKYLQKLLGQAPQIVAMDPHPAYTNRSLAKEIAEEYDAELIEVQHHWAHAASLLADCNIEESMILAIDGTGYGLDGQAWGGEILRADFNSFDRIAHLEPIPLLGGEKAVYDPRRLVFALDMMIGRDSQYFQGSESEILKKIMISSPTSTGFGRVLDALACHFKVCEVRTYDGEPAMKLERLLNQGSNKFNFNVNMVNNSLKTSELYREMLDTPGNPADLTYSFIYSLLEKMVSVASDEGERLGIKTIGITGGVSYNAPISRIVKTLVEEKGFKFICHDRVPNGDGGISTGQCAIALQRLA